GRHGGGAPCSEEAGGGRPGAAEPPSRTVRACLNSSLSEESALVTQTLVEHADDLIHRVMATPEGHADPYPLYRRLREVAPVHRSALDGNWYVTGFDACRQLLGDPRIGKNNQFIVPRHGVDPERVRLAQRRRRTSMLTANPPEHTRLR